MLEVRKLTKYYEIGEQRFDAVKGINLTFRQDEFVSILGESGSGKTTLLNLIGGLDRYNSGDIIIDNVSTKNYKDKDWDAYRNHRVGFVFQNYNLIAHLDVLSNVELAQTLSGVSREVRRKRALDVLTRVGLKDHVNKKPNQLSGGQQQRVSIARALVNNPTIILADEPTGALDSETSEDIMNLLKEISKDKLIIMVTHNADLAKRFSNRIVRLKDGEVIGDTNPYDKKDNKALKNETSKSSMSYFTALRLSFKNMLTKKTRTLITALAGSIGIIGVALVMSLQYGFTEYLNDMERGTFAGLPLEVSRSYTDFSAIINANRDRVEPEPVEGGIIGYEPEISFAFATNDITQDYIDYIENSELSAHGTIVYQYDYKTQYYYLDGNKLNANPTSNPQPPFSFVGTDYINQSAFSYDFVTEYFDIVSGSYYNPLKYEAVIVVDEGHRLPNNIMTFLGLSQNTIIPFENLVGQTFKIFTNNAMYKENDGIFTAKNTNVDTADLLSLYNDESNQNVITVTISGIIKVNTDFVSVGEGIYYTPKVAERIIELNTQSDVVVAQRASETSVVNGVTISLNNTKEDVLYTLGGYDIPSGILVYPNSFDDKEAILNILDAYNIGKDEEAQVNYVDTVASAVGMIKTVMDSISAVLIAFAAISLFVSSVMIGIITYTSVLERTKEIGVLRSIGARKKDISRVFNAEAILIGLFAGSLGVIITYLLVPIVNIFLAEPTGNDQIAQLFYLHALLLIGISVLLTFVAGLIPAKIASNKDPVAALRSE
ncbi:ATP-binding cassette domain-containing protein [Acholeplasma laidlawii]|uniref:ABC-type transport system, ATPase and permease components n=3 Tax=Acholeplasma laidlawii TaxID=2148 RepID=A9NE71_ACHLI|nr:ABC transporter ATP-binding protein/permease [Acholeplasma laidlawii]ABX80651.1 ABC-type transport system, ATPase and permease components [Acholeplasma laidlawii PG-8A]NWH11012.1 ATP-binding cassette domain-containing protein [Acholeplasma laidlawii]NWH12398.1 ATP-binding cassette domain-containing protein [Acholeplasma laidlawii]NWH13784.1 ATP-binding cassette domain-containing protein [Acholeplasma laidlawii]NWH15252.1 ATP-binding cassette domain-containing protein [Acholeplasma laidlawii